MNEYCISEKFVNKLMGYGTWFAITGFLIFCITVVGLELSTLEEVGTLKVGSERGGIFSRVSIPAYETERWCYTAIFYDESSKSCGNWTHWQSDPVLVLYGKLFTAVFFLLLTSIGIMWFAYDKQQKFRVKLCSDDKKLFWKNVRKTEVRKTELTKNIEANES